MSGQGSRYADRIGTSSLDFTVDAIEGLLSRPTSADGKRQRAVLALLLEHEAEGTIPTNVRFLFYELEQVGIVSKNFARGKRHDGTNLSEALMVLREHEIIPWSWVSDETRTVDVWRHAPSVKEFLLDDAEVARLNPWGDDEPPLLIVEGRDLAGVLRDLAYRYTVHLAGTAGQAGGFLRTDVLPIYEESERRVLYLGDLDLSGDQIEANTRAVLEREGGEAESWERIAITEEQAAELAAAGASPIEKVDKRYKPPKRHLGWETEALGQRLVIDLVRSAFDDLLPEPIEDVRVREAAERADAIKRLKRWRT